MAVPVEPNAEAWANLIQDQGQGQPLVQQQIQAQEQQPQAQARPPQALPGAAAAQIQVGEFTCLSSALPSVAICVSPFYCCPPLAYLVTVYLPDKKLGRVFDLRKSLVVCST